MVRVDSSPAVNHTSVPQREAPCVTPHPHPHSEAVRPIWAGSVTAGIESPAPLISNPQDPTAKWSRNREREKFRQQECKRGSCFSGATWSNILYSTIKLLYILYYYTIVLGTTLM